jgi:hypothetical protein
VSIVSVNSVGAEICDALGLKNVKSFELRMAVGEVATIRVEYFPDLDELKQLQVIIPKVELVRAEYNLIQKKEKG